jgi:hypothetical protein
MTSLHEAYANTDYFVNGLKTPLKINEVCPSLDQLLEQYEKSTYAYITAWNLRSQEIPIDENLTRNIHLSSELDKLANLVVIPGVGRSSDCSWEEESFLVIGITNEKAHSLALQFEQTAYLWGEKGGRVNLVFTERP